MLIPLVIFLTHEASKALNRKGSAEKISFRSTGPVFVLGFIVVSILANTLSLDPVIIDAGKEGSKIFLSIGLFAMGLGVKWKSISRLGSRPLVAGVFLWLLSASFALAVVILFGF
jgi:uncharacterized membrane protein YadS